MKKLLISLFTLLLALPALAEEVKKEANPFSFNGQVMVYGATYQTTNKDDKNLSFSAYRFRPYFAYATENVQAVIKFEFDQFLGQGSSAASDPYNSTYVKTGADTKGVLEVKAAYLNFNIPTVKGLSIKGGVDEYKTPGGFIIGTEIGQAVATYKFAQNQINAVFLKIAENTQTSESDDSRLYGLDVTLGLGDALKVRPALYVIQGGKSVSSTPWTDNMAYLPALGINFKADALSLNINGTYGVGKDKVTNIKYSGYALDIAPSYEIQKGIKAGLFFTMLSGDDGSSATEKKNFSSFQLKYDGFGRMFLMEQQQTFSNVAYDGFADVRKNSYGYMLLGATFNAKVEAFEVKINLAYGELMKAAAGKEKGLGFEADLSISYEVEKNAKIIADFGYLAAGNGYLNTGMYNNSGVNGATKSTIVNKEAAIYAAIGMSYKF